MSTLSRSDLYSLEQYAEKRAEFRQQVIAHKKDRQIRIGDHATLYFEDRLTIQYQVQEMLRIERIFEAAGIEEELEAYNPLIPEGSNLKATFMIEYGDVEERKKALAQLIGIEKQVWIEIDGCEKVYPITNEDLDRETEDKTSAVHFMRFEFSPKHIAVAKEGAAIRMGISHEHYTHEITLDEGSRQSLTNDFSA